MIVTVSLECHPPEVWNLVEGSCNDLVSLSAWLGLSKHCLLTQRKTALWIYFGVSNIVIEILLITLPSLLVYSIHMSMHNRIVVIGCFAIRIL